MIWFFLFFNYAKLISTKGKKTLMKKKNFLILELVLFLSGCSASSLSTFNSYTKDKDDYREIQTNGYYKPSEYNLSYQEILQDYPYSSSEKNITIPSTGERQLLVIPVDFTDYSCSVLNGGCKKAKNKIHNVFFGVDNVNVFNSVTSYFNSSSFGKLHLRGEVMDWYHSEYSTSDLIDNKMLVNNIAKSAIKYYKDQGVDLSKFNTDGDKYIDGIAFVYSARYQKKDTALWAYQSAVTSYSSEEFKEDNLARTYLWASYYYMNSDDDFAKVDAHTYIHETGHLLGLSDYYSQDATQLFKPMGGMDMMDYNLGDENTFSKMLLNWTRPYVIKDETTITINASYKNGDCILVPAKSWNGSAMDEYLLIELYSPKGLNAHDSKVEYTTGDKNFSLMTKPGIKIMHVDARIGHYMTFNQNPFIGYDGDEGVEETLKKYDSSGQRHYRKLAHSNTLSYSEDKIPLACIVDKHGDNYLKQGNLLTNDSLYVEGDVFKKDFTFNNGAKLEYNIRIDKLSSYKATLTFAKKIK